jgi:hypothetical protein
MSNSWHLNGKAKTTGVAESGLAAASPQPDIALRCRLIGKILGRFAKVDDDVSIRHPRDRLYGLSMRARESQRSIVEVLEFPINCHGQERIRHVQTAESGTDLSPLGMDVCERHLRARILAAFRSDN